jgi:hypothetical protein
MSSVYGTFSKEVELEIFKKQGHAWNFNLSGIGMSNPQYALLNKPALLVDGRNAPGYLSTLTPDQISEFFKGKYVFGSYLLNELWSLPPENDPGRKFLVKTDNTKLFTGFGSNGDKQDLDNVVLTLGKTRLNWATISLVSMNGNGFDPAAQSEPIKVLVAATGLMQNSDMELQRLEGDRITYGNKTGNAPVLCEGIPFSLQFTKAKELRCYPLDESGNRRLAIKSDGNSVVLSPEYKTVWYEIEVL